MTMTMPQACEAANCTPTTIHKLMKAGHIQAIQKKPRGQWHIQTARAEVKRIVAEHAPKASGKRSHPGGRRTAPKATKQHGGLRDALAFAVLDDSKRASLLALAERFTAAELSLLLTL